MIRAIGLHMRVACIQPEIDRAAMRLILPAAARIALPPLRGKGIKQDAVHRDAEGLHVKWHRLLRDFRVQRHLVVIALRRDHIGIVPVGKFAGFVIRNAVGLDAPVIVIRRDRHRIRRQFG